MNILRTFFTLANFQSFTYFSSKSHSYAETEDSIRATSYSYIRWQDYNFLWERFSSVLSTTAGMYNYYRGLSQKINSKKRIL